MEHLASLIALLVNQLIAHRQQPGETGLDNLVEVGAIVAIISLESICPANR